MLYGRPLKGLETRLAVIHPGAWQDSIYCSFEYESFKGSINVYQSYSALSYVWGTSTAKETIQIDGHDHKINVNLACAIRHLRDERHLIPIWIDAICINQDDVSERSSQVAMMRDIYAQAQRVIVFLGDGSYYRIPQNYRNSPPPAPVKFSTIDKDAPLILHFQKCWETLCKRPEWHSFCAICVLRLFEDVDTYRDTIKCVENGKASSKLKLFELVRQFMNTQWWQRVWVVQETTVSSEVVIQYGNVQIPWTTLASSASVCEGLGWGHHDLGSEHCLGIEREYAKVLPVFARHVFEIERLRREWKNQQGTGLLSLLQEFSSRKATDARDKVFALLGLASDISTIQPNYSLSTVQVYRHTFIDLIKHSGSLGALSGDMKRKNSGGIPTWIPDWSVAIEEPDRRRMQVEATCNISPRWRVEVIDREQEYWELVARNVARLHEEIEGGKRRPLPKDVVDGLICYETILDTKMYGTEWRQEEDLDILQKEAIALCKSMYADFKNDSKRFWSTTPVRKFIEAHLSLPHIPSSGEWYRRDIIKWCAKEYGARVLSLWFQELQHVESEHQRTRQLQSLLSDEEIDGIVADLDRYLCVDDMIRSDWTWNRYMRETFTKVIILVENKLLDNIGLTETDQEEVERLRSLIYEATALLNWGRILTRSTTFNGYGGASIGEEQLETLSELVSLASEVLDTFSRSNTLLAIEETKLACTSLIDLHHNNADNSEDDYSTIFSSACLFLGSATWMRSLRDDGVGKFDFDDEQLLESRRQRQLRAFSESESILGISSKYITTVGECTERLITWVDPASRIFTISQWAVCALRCKSQNFALRFATTLVSELYEESPGKFRRLRRSEENGLLRSWFETSLLPRLCEVNTAVDNQHFTWLMDGGADYDVELDIEKSFDEEMRIATEGRVFFTTEDHGMGLGPGSMMPGDEVHLLPGGNKPFVLRPREKARGSSTDEYELIGDCFYLVDGRESQENEHELLQGCLPVELLGRFLDRGVGSESIILC